MKTKVTTKVNTSTKATTGAEATVTVPATIKAAVKVVADSIAGRVAATQKEGASWYSTADALNKLYKTRELAAPVLKQAFEDAGLTEGMYASYRSNILTLAYPENEKLKQAQEEAKKDGLTVHKVIAVTRGGLKKSRKGSGEYIKVKREEKRGAHNRQTPLEHFQKAITLAITAAQTGKLDEDQVATALAEALEAAEYDLEAIAAVIAKS